MNKWFRKNWLYFLGGAIVFLVVLYEGQSEGDFGIFLQASQDLLQGKNIYATLYKEWYHYYYDVFFALLLFPLNNLPYYFVNLFWLFLNVFFVYRIWNILQAWLPLAELSKKSKVIFGVVSFLFVLSSLKDNFHLGQVTILILYLTLEGLFMMNTNRKIAGSFLMAFGIVIKILPIVFIPYLIYRKDFRSSVFVVLFIVLLLFFPALIIGMEYNNFLLTERWHLISPMNATHILDTSERSFHSLTTLLATLLVEDCGDYHALPIKRNIANISVESLSIVINIVRAVVIFFTLYFLRTKPFKKAVSNFHRLYEISYLCLIIPLIFPHQQHYAFFFAFPAISYVVFSLVYLFYNQEMNHPNKKIKTRKSAFLAFTIVVYFLMNSKFILGEFNQYYEHFKTLTYGAIMLVILLAVLRPDRVVEENHIVK